MSAARWRSASRALLALILERPERSDEVTAEDLESGPEREALQILKARRARGLPATRAALLELPEIWERCGPGYLSALAAESEALQVDFAAHLREARSLAVHASLVESVPSAAELRRLADQLEVGAPAAPMLTLADLDEVDLSWWWPGRLAWGIPAAMAGDGGVGKSTLAQELAARMTRGQVPPGGGSTTRPRDVIVLTAEEHVAAVVKPRMRLAGADLGRVRVVDPSSEEEAALTLPSGLERLEAECARGDVGMLIVDTGPAFLDPGLRSNREEDVRRLMAPLGRLAERHGLITIVLAHLNKASGSASEHRIMGGAAWRNAPRLVLLVGPPPGEDPRETGERVVAVEKSNLGPYPPAIGFRLAPSKEEPERAVVAWGGELSGVRAGDLVAPRSDPEERSEKDEAVTFLRAALAAGPRSAKEVMDEAREAGHSERTIKRAKGSAGVVSEKRGFAAGAKWCWHLAEGAHEGGQPPLAPFVKNGTGTLRENASTEAISPHHAPEGGQSPETGPLRGETDDGDLDHWERLAGGDS